jgi:hypothetical protein
LNMNGLICTTLGGVRLALRSDTPQRSGHPQTIPVSAYATLATGTIAKPTMETWRPRMTVTTCQKPVYLVQ